MTNLSQIRLLASCLLVLLAIARPVDASFIFANPAGFATQATSTPGTYNFKGTGDLTATVAFRGSEITLNSATMDFATAGTNNPAWLGGTRSMFRIEYGGSASSGPKELAEIEFAFANPLSTSSYLVFADFDSYEGLAFAAFDASNNLIPFSDFTLTRVDGEDPNGSAATTPTWTNTNPTQAWTSLSGNTGWGGTSAVSGYLVDNTNVSTNDVTVVLRSVAAISRVVFYYNAETASTSGNSIKFNFAAPAPSTVPEPASASVFSLLFLAGLAAYRRR